jgi:hypothetical protein
MSPNRMNGDKQPHRLAGKLRDLWKPTRPQHPGLTRSGAIKPILGLSFQQIVTWQPPSVYPEPPGYYRPVRVTVQAINAETGKVLILSDWGKFYWVPREEIIQPPWPEPVE